MEPLVPNTLQHKRSNTCDHFYWHSACRAAANERPYHHQLQHRSVHTANDDVVRWPLIRIDRRRLQSNVGIAQYYLFVTPSAITSLAWRIVASFIRCCCSVCV